MKYKRFRTMARIIEILAFVAGIGVFFLGILSSFTGEGDSATIMFGFIIGIGGGFFTFIYLYVLAQFIYVILDIERNTRATVKALYEEVEKDEGVEKVANIEAQEGE